MTRPHAAPACRVADIAAGALIAAINIWAAGEVLWKARAELSGQR